MRLIVSLWLPLCSEWTFRETVNRLPRLPRFLLSSLLNFVDMWEFVLKLDKNNREFIWRRRCDFVPNLEWDSLNSSFIIAKNVLSKCCREKLNRFFFCRIHFSLSHKVFLSKRMFQNCYDMVWYAMVWYNVIWYGMMWYDMVWYDVIWYDMIWYGMMWYGMV
jgi:hypothetical protein